MAHQRPCTCNHTASSSGPGRRPHAPTRHAPPQVLKKSRDRRAWARFGRTRPSRSGTLASPDACTAGAAGSLARGLPRPCSAARPQWQRNIRARGAPRARPLNTAPQCAPTHPSAARAESWAMRCRALRPADPPFTVGRGRAGVDQSPNSLPDKIPHHQDHSSSHVLFSRPPQCPPKLTGSTRGPVCAATEGGAFASHIWTYSPARPPQSWASQNCTHWVRSVHTTLRTVRSSRCPPPAQHRHRTRAYIETPPSPPSCHQRRAYVPTPFCYVLRFPARSRSLPRRAAEPAAPRPRAPRARAAPTWSRTRSRATRRRPSPASTAG